MKQYYLYFEFDFDSLIFQLISDFSKVELIVNIYIYNRTAKDKGFFSFPYSYV